MGAWCFRSAKVDDGGVKASCNSERDIEAATIGSVLVFANPNSGSGNALRTFRERLEPQLRKNHIEFELIITNGSSHAKSVIRSHNDLGKFNGIVILSGDGLVSEVLNGLVEREDRTSIVPSMPIGVVPCGSGNGLLSSLFFSQNEPLVNPKFTNRAVEVCCSPESRAQPVNLLHVQTDKENIASFLSIGWGLIADIDIESEQWRQLLGSSRFVVGSLIRALKLRTYRGRLSYKPYVPGKQDVEEKYDIYGKTTGERMMNFSSTCHREPIDSSHRVLDDAWRSLQTEKVVDVEKDVSDDWIQLEDEFVSVYAVTLSHISSNAPFVPQARLNDDRIYLTYILRKDIPSRLSLIKFLIAIESQKHLKMPFVKVVEVGAFRLEPLVSGSYIVVDGEVVEATKIQAVTSTLKMAFCTLAGK